MSAADMVAAMKARKQKKMEVQAVERLPPPPQARQKPAAAEPAAEAHAVTTHATCVYGTALELC